MLRFVDIVSDESVVRRDKWRVTDLESVRYEEEDERKRASISVFFLLHHCFALEDHVRERELKWSERVETMIQTSLVRTRVELCRAHVSNYVAHIFFF